MRLLFLSTPVGPLGSGLGGGVELTVLNLVKVLQGLGHEVAIAAPQGSVLPTATCIPIPGEWQPTAQTQGRDTPAIVSTNSVLANLWDYARRVQHDYDLLVNFAYDWLPFYLTPFFSKPIAHFVSMGSLNTLMDAIVTQVGQQFPGTLGAYTQSQIETFPPLLATQTPAWRILGSAIDLEQYAFCDQPEPALVWMGRISPEKGLEDAVAAAQATQTRLKILGKLEDPDYWQRIQNQYPDAPVDYLGFLATSDLQVIVRRCQALIMTPRWVEAFGNVAIEALACGVPVIAYQRGGPSEIIEPGKTGWLVAPDSVDGLIQAIGKLSQLDRQACRQAAETQYSLPALGKRFESWFNDIVSGSFT
jgi:UDP-glucose:tetrahydrobiopterin glucosyltransferase